MLFATVVSQSIMHMHVPYNTACFVLYTMHAAVEAAAAPEGNCLVELIIPAYSVGFSVANLYTRPAHATLQVARCNFQLQNICQQSSLNLALQMSYNVIRAFPCIM